MRLNVMLEPQEGVTYAEQLAVARRAEELGFEGFYRSDHYRSVGGFAERGSTDAWAVLAGIARETSRIALGTLVSPVTFRPVGNLAKVVATVAEMAGTVDGTTRVHLGMGTGWLEGEHREFGFPFEDLGTRFDRLEEHLHAVTALFDPAQERVTVRGEHVGLDACRFLPKPQPRPRIILGGRGPRRTPRLAARYADELNTAFATPDHCRTLRAAADRACERLGRDPATLPLTLMTGCLVGRDEADFRDRVARLQSQSDDQRPHDAYVAALAGEWVLGTPDRAAQRLDELTAAGVAAVMLQDQLPEDLDMLDVARTLA